jgi:hypothetical protein
MRWGAFSTFISPKISRFLENNLSPSIEGAPSQKLYLKNGTVEFFLNGGDGFPRVKLPKISRLFENNLSPGVGGVPSQKPISQKRCSRKFFGRRSCIQHIQMSQNQSFIWQKFIPRWRPGDNVISQLFSKSDLA